MPFKNVRQEMAMKINAPHVWREWVEKYGHAPGWKEYERRAARKAAMVRKGLIKPKKSRKRRRK